MQRQPDVAVASPTLNSPVLPARVPRPSAPRTPTGNTESLPPLGSANTNRYSTDSWNSSNCDPADDMEWEWKPEQIIFLKRTLENLPAHLLTPFNGPVPPSNLLDKIAKAVASAKGPLEWPHSLRATRAKTVELARLCAKEGRDGESSDTIAEEETAGSDVPLKQTTNTGPKRPLYRQSSMDFIQPAKPDIKDNGNLRRLSRRLQRTDRVIESPYHPYASHRSSSPAYGSLRPSTPSSATLNSNASGSRRPCRMKRSMSSLSSMSDASRASNPQVQRIIGSNSFAGSGHSLKRAPSFGAGSRTSLDSGGMSVDHDAKDSDVTSDEEEKVRSKKRKKARTKATPPAPPPPATPLTSAPPTATQRRKAEGTSSTPPSSFKSHKVADKVNNSDHTAKRRRSNVKRNPSILGPELPNPQPCLEAPSVIIPPYSPARTMASTLGNNSPYKQSHQSPAFSPNTQPTSPTSSRPLRRSKPGISISRLAPARIIAFEDIPPTSPEKPGLGTGFGLASAFQLN